MIFPDEDLSGERHFGGKIFRVKDLPGKDLPGAPN